MCKTEEVIITDDLLKRFGNALEQMKSNVKINVNDKYKYFL